MTLARSSESGMRRGQRRGRGRVCRGYRLLRGSGRALALVTVLLALACAIGRVSMLAVSAASATSAASAAAPRQVSQPASQQAGQQPSAQAPMFSTRVEFVRVDVLVTNRGSSVVGLRADDFELRDNGVPQRVSVMDTSALPVDVALALDVSSSVSGDPLVKLQDAATNLVDNLREGDRVSLLSFSDLLWIHVPLTKDFARTRQLIASMKASGSTSLRDAAYAAMLQGDPDSGRALVVLFTDGEDVSSWLSESALVDTAKRINAVVYSVALGSAGDAVRGVVQDDILDKLPDLTGGRRLSAAHPDRLREVFGTIINEFRQRYVLSYEPRGVDRAGYHTIDVRLTNGRKGDTRARPGYFRPR
jgi:Ca-activated chloride channel family protein